MGFSKSKVIYDDDCHICSNFKDWLESRDEHGQLEFEGSSENVRFSSGLGFIDTGGKEIVGTRAVLIAIAQTKGLIGISARIMSVWPLYLWLIPFYRFFAANRKKLNTFFNNKNV
tara:strand:- start:689 stop:1033 length:345 start_codon:yes stop_codon:yes gene_type:complete